jgi:hypothetical protein
MRLVRWFIGVLLAPALAAAILAPTVATAACEAEHARYLETVADFDEAYIRDNDPMGSKAAVNIEWLRTMDDVDNLREDRDLWGKTYAGGSPESAIKGALIVCIYNARIDELTGGGGPASRTTASSRASDRTASADGPASSESAFLYDDDDHSQCVDVQAIGESVGTGLAYGHYRLVNKCAYPIKLLTCIDADRADGSPAGNYDAHEEGRPCPGMGWLGTALTANEVKDEREWFRYRNLKWEVRACREGWDFVGEDGANFPANTLGSRFRCRKLR